MNVKIIWEGHKNWLFLFQALDVASKYPNLEEDCVKFLWPSQKTWTLNLPHSHEIGYFRAKNLAQSMHIVWVKTNNNNKWLVYGYFWPFFLQLYVHLSQNWGSDDHFGVLNRPKIWLVLSLWHKVQIFPFSVFCNFVQKHALAFFTFLRFVS